MREIIIKYLQGMQCEWFPVEWDSFVVEWLVAAAGYGKEPGETIDGLKIKYEFTLPHVTVLWSDKNEPKKRFYYGTLDRCKALLLNAVRSVDEPKRRAAGIDIKNYNFATGGDCDLDIYYHSRNEMGIAWENGEFK